MEEILETESSIPCRKVAKMMKLIFHIDYQPGWKSKADTYFRRLIEYLPSISRDNDLFPAQTFGSVVRHLCAKGYTDQVHGVVSIAKAEGVGLRYIYYQWLNAALQKKQSEVIDFVWKDIRTVEPSALSLPLKLYDNLIYWYAMKKQTRYALEVYERRVKDKSNRKSDKLPPTVMAALIYGLAFRKRYTKAAALVKLFQHEIEQAKRKGAAGKEASGEKEGEEGRAGLDEEAAKENDSEESKQTEEEAIRERKYLEGAAPSLIRDVAWKDASMWQAWSAFFEGCVENGHNKRVVRIYQNMRKRNTVPSTANRSLYPQGKTAILYLMTACARVDRYDLVAAASVLLPQMGSISLLTIFYNVFGSIDHSARYIGKENMKYILPIWKNLRMTGFTPTQQSYVALLELCATHGDYFTAAALSEEMKSFGIEPNDKIMMLQTKLQTWRHEDKKLVS